MKPAPPPLTRGPGWLQTWLNEVLAFAVATRPLPSETCDISEQPDGTRIDPDPVALAAATEATREPFELAVQADPEDESESPTLKIRVYPSTLAGGSSTDLGFAAGDDPPYLLTASAGILQGGITIDGDGAITSRWLEIVASLSADTSTNFYVEIGTVAAGETAGTWIVTNSRYGPIAATICRNWFAAEAPFYGVTWL